MALRFPQQLLLTALLPGAPPLKINGLASDSREIGAGMAFCATRGLQHHGLSFYEAAVQAQAAVVLWEPPFDGECPQGKVPLVEVPNLRRGLARLAERASGFPSRRLQLIGITGTDGKTSCSHFLAQILASKGGCGVIGTLGTGHWPTTVAPTHTTPDALAVVNHLMDFVEQKCAFASMEVSSHALDQGRVDGLCWASTLLTQISRDHLDYHGSLANYVAAKKRLFFDLAPRQVVLNADDPQGAAWLTALPDAIAYGFSDTPLKQKRFVQGRALQLTPTGLRFEVNSSWGMASVAVSLLGAFNGANVLGCLAVLLSLDQSLSHSCRQLTALKPVRGRMESVVLASSRPTVIIDYAHTPHALEQALKAIRGHQPHSRLTCVFGCGGDRDTGKRSQMGEMAAKWADSVVITSDNPRREAPETIVAHIMEGVSNADRKRVTVELDRKAAIIYALDQAVGHDPTREVVLIAGKGHENYQEINGLRREFSDHAVVRAYFGETV